jgi:uncharacterized membrane protein
LTRSDPPDTGLRERDFARLTNLADGIFAVAMTFLAFQIQLPAPEHGQPADVLAKLHAALPQLGALVVTYLLAARYWLLHCDMHRAIVRGDPPLLHRNLMFLLAVVLLPFTTDVLGAYPRSALTVDIYAGNVLILAALMWSIWHYAVRHPDCLASSDALPRARISRRIVSWIVLVVLLAGLLAWVSPLLGIATMVLIPLVQRGLVRLATVLETARVEWG